MRILRSIALAFLLSTPILAQPVETPPTEVSQPSEPAQQQEQPSDPTESPTTEADAAEKNSDFLGPSGGQLGIGGDNGFGVGTAIGDPTALYGPTRTPVVLFGTDRESLIDFTGYYSHKIGDNQRILLEGHLDPNFLGADLSYTISPQDWKGAITSNFWISSGTFAPFQTDGFRVFLPFNEKPFVQSLGGGVEYVHPFSDELDVAFGLNYQQYAFSTDLLSGNRYRTDQNFFPLTASGDSSSERFVSFRVNGLYSTFDDRNLPKSGSKLRFGMEQAIDLGASSTSFNRLSANFTHLFPAPGLNDGDHTVLLNLQAGTIIGDPSPIRAFHMGGAQSVRGYEPGELASGKSFFQGTLEYRHHLKSFTVFDTDFDARVALFGDYGSVLGTVRDLNGMPPILRGKPGHGFGYGAGIHLGGEYGLFKLESAWNDRGQNSIYFTVGERF